MVVEGKEAHGNWVLGLRGGTPWKHSSKEEISSWSWRCFPTLMVLWFSGIWEASLRQQGPPWSTADLLNAAFLSFPCCFSPPHSLTFILAFYFLRKIKEREKCYSFLEEPKPTTRVQIQATWKHRKRQSQILPPALHFRVAPDINILWYPLSSKRNDLFYFPQTSAAEAFFIIFKQWSWRRAWTYDVSCATGLQTSVADLGIHESLWRLQRFFSLLAKGQMPAWKAQVPIKALLLLNILHPGSSSSDTPRNKINQTLNKLPCQETNSAKPAFQGNVKCCNCTSVLGAFQRLPRASQPESTSTSSGLITRMEVDNSVFRPIQLLPRNNKKNTQTPLIILSCSELFPGKGKKKFLS